jgi:hypothetical protein
VIFPKFNPDSALQFSSIEKSQLFFSLIENSFNYHILGETGFDTLLDVIDVVDGFSFEYSDNDSAINAFEELVNDYKPQ